MRKGMMKAWIAGTVLCLMATMVVAGGATAADILLVAGRHAVKLGEPAPNFQLLDMQGRLVALSDLRGKVMMVNFWATWCGPCRASIPHLQKLHDTYGKKGLVVLSVTSAFVSPDARTNSTSTPSAP